MNPTLSKPSHVLIVDDDPMVLDSLREELEDHYVVTPASNGSTAVALLEQHHYDAIISDMRMPGMSGVQVLAHARQNDTSIVPILLTGFSDHAAHTAAKAKDGIFKLTKPWGDELEITLRRALEHRQHLKTIAKQIETERMSRQRAELAVVQLDKLASLGTLAAGIAHEMRSPLSYIQANFDWLQEELVRLVDALSILGEAMFSESPSQDVLDAAAVQWKKVQSDELLSELSNVRDECASGLHRMTDILDGLRTYSQPKRDRAEILNISRCIKQAVQLVVCKYKHNAMIFVDVDTHIVAWGHEGEIVQVLINLMVNAIQAMEERGDVHVGISQTPSTVCIHVKDTGPGVPEHVIPRLFEPFFTTKGEQGNGLGLSISKEIAKRHGGDLQFESTDQGATFSIILPTSDPNKQSLS